MAKQSGLHQLRGKVGEHSYYRQTGIESGIVRSINQAMSAKVKTDEAFANTRLNNAEFGQAGRIASVLGNYITPKFRPMILPFSQSKMAKIILEYIKNDTTSPWGQRNLVVANSGEAQVAALNLVAKNNFADFGLSIVLDEEVGSMTVSFTNETVAKLSAIGADGINFNFLAISTWIGTFDDGTGKYAPSYPRANVYPGTIAGVNVGDELVVNYKFRPIPPQGWPAFPAEHIGLLVAMPYRTVNSDVHILQEYCSFKAFVIADGAVN